ncbi:thiosulfate/3-mercaptopyruvate sulfurtransferase [Halarchaeum rubridurum]|uniref:Thiosulfate sulfurtransferase n=1 Tax=Halarchaeum rubridurum TaxID=489911 RepID=A0A830G699_9EURY|nr:sulfurtransferase [Halarchaeum rubridurum]MBP1955974.1 thiosulfate/3-mercaptopyruvate sulfurtransferase [Halarchaeum rubridurum]GGM76306.1 thiosulfate sulfurtransferase [Halarchaeum rubridurum]
MDEDVIVSAEWLDAHRAEPGVVVVDVRDAWEYDGIGHVPGAVNVPFDAFRGGGEEGMLPPEDEWATLLGECGIDADTTVVAYDDTHGVFAARFLVTALLYGHDDLRLLNGDYSAWMQGHETSTDEPDVETTTYAVERPTESPLVTIDEVAAATEAENTVVVDTREPAEYAEGHIPGAVNLDWKEVVDEETRGLKARADVEALFAEKGVTPEKHVVLYCNTARRISHTFVVLRWLGYPDVSFYEGSLTEWKDADRPLETGDADGDVSVEGASGDANADD